jgi:hypothetical protein
MSRALKKIALGVTLGIASLCPTNSYAKFLWFGKDEVPKNEGIIENVTKRAPDYEELKEISDAKDLVGRNFNAGIVSDNIMPRLGRKDLRSEGKNAVNGYLDQLDNVIQADYGHYFPFSEFMDTRFYQSEMERMIYDDKYGIDARKILYEAGKLWLGGFEKLDELKQEAKKISSAEFKIEKTSGRIGAKYSSESFLKPYLELENFIGVDKLRILKNKKCRLLKKNWLKFVNRK